MTPLQMRYFFELCSKAGINPDDAKQRAKEKYNKEHFEDITTEELQPLIAILEKAANINKIEHPKGDFPNEWLVYDKLNKRFLQEQMTIDIVTFDPDRAKERLHFMQFTGRRDENSNKIFDYDWIESIQGKRYIVQWGWKDCGWVTYDEDTNEMYNLSSFGKLKRLGSTYDDI
jgi:hypothetical protein